MPNILIKQPQVNIYQRPNSEAHSETGLQLTIGDLHGNAMKLMFMLIKHGIASNISEQDYATLVEIYQKDLEAEDLARFNQILSQIKFSQDKLVRLIGDEVADRGCNDYFTLKILQKMNEHGVPVEILVSNHGIEFIEAYEKGKPFISNRLLWGQANSMAKLQGLINRALVSRDEILEIVKLSYKPTLRLISYSLSEDEQEITLYSHAAMGLDMIVALAQQFNVPLDNLDANGYAQAIDNINSAFQMVVQQNRVHTLYNEQQLEAASGGEIEGIGNFISVTWNRNYTDLKRPPTNQHRSQPRIYYVHGHDSTMQSEGHIFNLDNQLGKVSRQNVGEYTVLCSYQVKKPVLEFKAEPNVESHQLPQLLENPTPHIPAPRPNLDPTSVALGALEQNFLHCLKNIESKAKNLEIRGHKMASSDAWFLYQIVRDAHMELKAKKINVEYFKMRCFGAINTVRPELEKHRGWKQILGNLALLVMGFGIFYVIAGLMNKAATGNFLFFKTDSAYKIDALEESVKAIIRPK